MHRIPFPALFDADLLSLQIRGRLNTLMADWLPSITKVVVDSPSEEDFLQALKSEGLLPFRRGKIKIQPEEDLPSLDLRVPLPFQGIFIHSNTSHSPLGMHGKNSLWTWCPSLAEAGGARFVRGNTHREQVSYRIGTGDGRYLEIPITNMKGDVLSDALFMKKMQPSFHNLLILSPEQIPEGLQQIIHVDISGPLTLLSSKQTAYDKQLLAIRKYALDMFRDNGSPSSDHDDLNHRMLITYNIWLICQIANQIWSAVLRTMQTTQTSSTKDIWKALLDNQSQTIESNLFNYKKFLRDGKLHSFRPTNPVDAISQLTQLKRYDMSTETLGYLPPVYHQNHPSFLGRICPVETPESESLGISLHLAKGAGVDELGKILPCDSKEHGLGWAASMIPLFEHNDAVRNMMGAKNLKQALPINGRQTPSVISGEEQENFEAIKPLVQFGIVPDMRDSSGNFSPGIDLLVAYMPYYGLNFEDAIVVNRDLLDNHLLDYVKEEELTFRIKPGFAIPSKALSNSLTNSPDNINSQLAKPGIKLYRGTELARLWNATSGQASTIVYKDYEQADLLDILLDYDTCFGGKLICHIRKYYPIGPGDKLMGRHGNKGVISALLTQDEMPRLPDTSDLPESIRNRAVDLVLNPHGVISRMNVAQLMETHLGWLFNARSHDNTKRLNIDCGPFAQQYTSYKEKISASLKAKGLDAYGRTRLVLPNGILTELPVVVGFQHIVRLRHIPTLKSQSRGHNQKVKYNIQTGQAVHGKRQGGGQRIGEMELWALSAHCANDVISEILRIKSDLAAFCDNKKRPEYSTTWKAIQDYLFALGINANFRDNKVSFGWLSDKVDSWSAGHVTNTNDSKLGSRSVFKCRRCDYRPPINNVFHESNKKYATLEQVLKEMGLACPSQPKSWEKEQSLHHFRGVWSLPYLEKDGEVKAQVICEEHQTDITIQLTVYSDSISKQIKLCARGRKPNLGGNAKNKTKSGFTVESISGNSVTDRLLPIGKLRVSCSAKHPSQEIRPVEGTTREDILYSEGGIFCPSIFGDISKIKADYSFNNWGSIPLPWYIQYPFEAFMTEKQRKIYQKTGKIRDDFPHPGNFPEINYLPVLPLRYRFPETNRDRPSYSQDVNGLYREILEQVKFIEIVKDKVSIFKSYLESLTDKLKQLDLLAEENKKSLKCPEDLAQSIVELFFTKIINDNTLQALLSLLPSKMTRNLRLMIETGPKDSKITELLNNQVKRRQLIRETRSLFDLDYLGQNLRNKIIAIFDIFVKRLAGRIPKEGMLRRHGLGRRVDCSGRLVIIPDPDLTPDKVKVPCHILWNILQDNIITWIEKVEHCFKDIEASSSQGNHIQGDILSASILDDYIAIKEGKILDSKSARKQHIHQALTQELIEDKYFLTLKRYIHAHPEKVILLNRQPSLHKYSMLAFHPIPTHSSQGEVMRISPLVCGAFGADFDGDEMALHWPITDKAQQEAKKLLFSKNLLSEATGTPIVHYSQDIVLGIYWLKKQGLEQEIYKLLPDHSCDEKCCRAVLKNQQSWNRRVGLDLIQHLCINHPQNAENIIHEISLLGFKAATEAGVSFGYYDLTEPQSLSEKTQKLISDINGLDKHEISDPEVLVNILVKEDKKLENMTLDFLPGQEPAKTLDPDGLGIGMSAIAHSRARGTSQAKQLVAMRGFLSPGSIGFDESPESFFFKHALRQGCDKATYFKTSYNARSSMCDKKIGTAQAGSLTRQLVAALWGFTINEKDCGVSGDRNPLTCITASGVCQVCYGTAVDPNSHYIDQQTGLYQIGYPAGLVAAQCLGERGTQLTMQSFHTGKRVFTVNTVLDILNNPEHFDFEKFSQSSPICPSGMDNECYRQYLEQIYNKVPQVSNEELEKAIEEVSRNLAQLSSSKNKNKIFKKNVVRLRNAVNDMNCSYIYAHQSLQSKEKHIQRVAKDSLLVLSKANRVQRQSIINDLNIALANLFVASFSSIPAYNNLHLRHIQLLWRAIHRSKNSQFTGTRMTLPPLAALSFCTIRRQLMWATIKSKVDLLEHPVSRIMTGLVMR